LRSAIVRASIAASSSWCAVHSDLANSAITLAKNGKSHLSSGTLGGGAILLVARDMTRTASDALSIRTLRVLIEILC
jgi:hypothetical protein